LTTTKFQELKQTERDLRRQIILDAALVLFADKDFRSVTVREIARQAGVSIGTIYNYYPNLTELFLDVFLNSAEEITRMLDALNNGHPAGLETICELYIAYLNDNMTFYQMMSHFMLGGDLSSETTVKLNAKMKELLNRLEAALANAGLQTDTRLTAHALFSALNGIMISYARYPGKTDPEIRRHTLRLSGIIAAVFTSHITGKS
jgi:AcrR family transcriptional regulator